MIYLIITTCIHRKFGIDNLEERIDRYFECISHLAGIVRGDHSIKPIIVENSGLNYSFLDGFGCDVVYTNNNAHPSTHKAVNEFLDIDAVIRQYNIQDDDIVVKLTGRYKLLDNAFLETVKTHANTHDAFVKFFNVCSLEYLPDDCVLGLFALKRKHWDGFKYEFRRSPECEFAEYIRNLLGDKVMEINTLNLECQFADDLRKLCV